MKKPFFVALGLFALLPVWLAAAAAAAAAAEESKEDDSAVLVLTNSNFDETLKQNEVVLVKFYAPWCGHCKRMAPEYAKAAQLLQQKGSKVVLAKVDATAETDLANKHDISEFPTVTLFRNQKPEQYTGGRTAEAIVEWVETMTGPAVTEVSSREEAAARVSREAPVAFVAELSAADSEVAKTFWAAAEAGRQLGKFYCTYGAAPGAERVSAVRFEEGWVPFEGEAEPAALRAFLETESFPLLGPINGENFRKYVERDAALVWFCGAAPDFDQFKDSLRAAAKAVRSDFHFVWLDTDSFRGHAEAALGLAQFPGLVAQTRRGRFVLPAAAAAAALRDAAAVTQFLADVAAGKVERALKSEPVPESNAEPVKVVVGKTFEQLVLQDARDVFLEVYAPWCGYCKSFEPVYREFAERHRANPRLLVAKMDGTANEAPLEAFEWNSFPTIFFVRAGAKSPLRYEGARTVDGLSEFLQKHASAPRPDKGEEL
ncbi:protein disulfide isomerase, putative [Eimeria tenella]|uniref:Protein disulfide-isomerase n=1 Tax=Eimeria tenella TaxID=5802 RepID=U6KSC9_EIMTE|nr:protein disulfide isomerase, putative [Eimeria tenella]CDJ40881.1 protein disulfide isomerase, putative [Eimeria tenella]|eukprot:XP_013231631.1 protein disulfide isomerase, putative [Eimeria tenella]